MSLYVINNQSEIDRREIETNLQSQSQAFDCIINVVILLNNMQGYPWLLNSQLEQYLTFKFK